MRTHLTTFCSARVASSRVFIHYIRSHDDTTIRIEQCGSFVGLESERCLRCVSSHFFFEWQFFLRLSVERLAAVWNFNEICARDEFFTLLTLELSSLSRRSWGGKTLPFFNVSACPCDVENLWNFANLVITLVVTRGSVKSTWVNLTIWLKNLRIYQNIFFANFANSNKMSEIEHRYVSSVLSVQQCVVSSFWSWEFEVFVYVQSDMELFACAVGDKQKLNGRRVFGHSKSAVNPMGESTWKFLIFSFSHFIAALKLDVATMPHIPALFKSTRRKYT